MWWSAAERGTRLELCKGAEVVLFASLLEAFNVLWQQPPLGLYWSHLPPTRKIDSLVVMRLTPRFFDSSFKALHQDPFHLLFQLFSDSAHPSREAASSFAASSSVAPCLAPSLLSWKYCMKYSVRVTREAMNSVTMHSHCGSSNQRYELEVSNSDILCTWKRCGQLNRPPLENFAATSYYVFGKRREKTMEAASHTY